MTHGDEDGRDVPVRLAVERTRPAQGSRRDGDGLPVGADCSTLMRRADAALAARFEADRPRYELSGRAGPEEAAVRR